MSYVVSDSRANCWQGVLRINHISDEILKDAVPDVTIIRAGYFAEDFAHAFASIKADPPVIVSLFSPADFKVPMVIIQAKQ